MHDFQDSGTPVTMNNEEINNADINRESINEGDNSERNINERRSVNTRNSHNRRRTYVISLVIGILAIIVYKYSSESPIERNIFEEFMNYFERLGFGLDIFKLPSNEIINQNIINCTSLAHRIEQSVAFNDTGPQLVEDLNKFSSQLEIAKSSYTKMYTDGAWFIWNFEQFINDTLNHISSDSFMSTSSRKNLQSSIKGSIEALNNFYSSVEKAREATLTAESFRSGTHKQVIKAKEEVEKFISRTINESPWNKFREYIISIFDTTDANDKAVDVKIAKSLDGFLNNLDKDLLRIAGVLLNFKTNLEGHARMLHKLEADIENLKQSKWDEYEIKKVRELLNMIKENHKNFKSRVNQ